MLTNLQQLRLNTLNEFVFTRESGEEFHAHQVFILLKSSASRNAETTEVHRNGAGFAIRHKRIICMAGADPLPTSIDTFTVTGLDQVQDNIISARKP